MYSVILASASPRRREILDQVGIKYTVIPCMKEEVIKKETPEEIVKELSMVKAEEAAVHADKNTIVIGADTVVVYENKILGKPKNEEDAVQMLQKLQGNIHTVYTGVALIIGDKKINFAVETKVAVYSMTTAQIELYVWTGEPLDKAGSYGIQGKFAVYIKEIAGDYYNVVGLPISAICETLKGIGIELV